MNKLQSFLIAVTIFALILSVSIIGCSSSKSSGGGGGSGIRVAFIYNDDQAAANDYKTFLDSRGFNTILIKVDDITSRSFASYEVIFLGANSGGYTTWGDNASRTKLVNSNKPMIGLGEGGYAFFGKLGLEIGYGNGLHSNDNGIEILDNAHSIYSTPNTISIPADSFLQIYTASWVTVSIKAESPLVNVLPFGRSVSGLFTFHYPLIQEDTRYLVWGFQPPPPRMTDAGRNLFENVVRYMMQ